MTLHHHATIDTPLGELLIVADAEAIVGIYFPDQAHPPTAEHLGEVVRPDDDPLIARAATQLREYFDGERQTFDFPLATDADDFSERVWAELRDIPYGRTITYGEIATSLGKPGAAQAVGRAVGHNPISIVVPCHRVIGADGSLTGYAGGLERKRALLDLEAGEGTRLF